jgi:putative FmdB family regulatory protein
MPIYLMKCDACGEEYEDFRQVSDKDERGRCIVCGSPRLRRTEVFVEDCCGCSESVPLDADACEVETCCSC